MGKGDRPEHAAPPEVFYGGSEAAKYTSSSRVVEIQEKLTARALELLALEDDGTPKFLLDIGCGSGLSGQVLTDEGASLLLPRHIMAGPPSLFPLRRVPALSRWPATVPRRARLGWMRHLRKHATGRARQRGRG